MKENILEFVRRGLTACGFGPIVLAMLYLILHKQGVVDVLTVDQVCTGIFSITALAFIAGGMNFIYQIERLPLTIAILIHGCTLYAVYLSVYLINGWLQSGKGPVLVFTGIFVGFYLVIWAVIYTVTKSKTEKVNERLKMKQGK